MSDVMNTSETDPRFYSISKVFYVNRIITLLPLKGTANVIEDGQLCKL